MPLSGGQARIRVTNLNKYFYTQAGRVEALHEVSFSVPAGEFWCVIGPSGCGKTTLLRILAGLEKQTSGDIQLLGAGNNRPLSSMVFQEKSVFPWLNVWDNVAWGLQCRRVPKAQIKPVVEAYLNKFGLWSFRHAYPHQLSGGMNQRVSVARAFANDPEILLMDEPFGALDAQTRSVLQEELLRIWEENRKTVIFITHSLDESLLLADRIIVMSRRPGRIKELVHVGIPRPRSQAEVRKSHEFSELFTRLWESLRDEVQESIG
ncbi:MAG: ABC transporter ATP-binding protein [Anaerolineae bacterium]